MLINIWHFIKYIIIKRKNTEKSISEGKPQRTHSPQTRSTHTLPSHTSLAHIRCHKLTHTHTHSYIISLALLSVFGKTFSRFFECGKRTKRKRKQAKRKRKEKKTETCKNLIWLNAVNSAPSPSPSLSTCLPLAIKASAENVKKSALKSGHALWNSR